MLNHSRSCKGLHFAETSIERDAPFESFRDPLIILVSVPTSVAGALIFIALGIGGATLNIYTEAGLVTLGGLISKHGILIVEFANIKQKEGMSKRVANSQ